MEFYELMDRYVYEGYPLIIITIENDPLCNELYKEQIIKEFEEEKRTRSRKKKTKKNTTSSSGKIQKEILRDNR